VVWLGLLLVLLPVPLHGQEEELLSQAELEYEAAVQDHESALAARAVVDSRFARFAEEADEARRVGDTERMERAFAQAQNQLLELRRLDRRVQQTESALQDAREAYVAALERRLDALVEQARTASPDELLEIQVLVADLNNRVREVDQGLGVPVRLGEPVMPEVVFDPRDGELELRAKAELLERAAARYDSLLVEVDDRVAELERRARRDRSLEDMLQGLDRFGETQLPVRTPQARARTGGEEQLAEGDSIESERVLSSEERIELLRLLREELESTREQLLVRARVFRDRAGGDVVA
jgi:hypothetical protein